jgi:hypothetical protein
MSLPLLRTAPFAILGWILSSYALYVEHKVAHKSPDEEFSALCDIQQINASCRYEEWKGFYLSMDSCVVERFSFTVRYPITEYTKPKQSVELGFLAKQVFSQFHFIFLSNSHISLYHKLRFYIVTVMYSSFPRVACCLILESFRKEVCWMFLTQH